ncbi:glutamate racemase [Gudongella sp. DL1XJH-153]|uniref:glutamate racemase n=1 Tax=Gudongella sp. DL1XJH-153 TaxID=3409804 RepID=UPI003BB79163
MEKPIGVLDSGVGGLTVVKSIQKILPHEDIIYFGDSKNVPYGNRDEEEIYRLTMAMLKYFEKRDVKMVAIACNTISTMADRFRDKFDFPIVDIISPTVDHIENMGINKMVILGTDFTIRTKAYERLLRERRKDYEISSEKSPRLAELVDKGDYRSREIYDTISGHLQSISQMGNFYNIVLACTHYPIVEDVFLELDPTLNYINPGFQQAKAMRMVLHAQGTLKKEGKGTLQILTSGFPEIYKAVVEKLEMLEAEDIKTIEIPPYKE